MNGQKDEECICCGSCLTERLAFVTDEPELKESTELMVCPFCEGPKCIMCDMGADVRCMRCEGEGDI